MHWQEDVMASELILSETRGRVGIVTLNRPDSLNALTGEMRTTMRAQIAEWNEEAGIGAIVITGAGRAFCAGADVSSFQQPPADRGSEDTPEQQVSPWAGFVRGSKPTVCAINGVAVGEGVTMTLPCDVRLAAPDARLSFRFVRLGLTPEIGSSHILPHLAGLGRAMELMLTGRFFTGDEAREYGIVLETRPKDELLDRAVELAAEIAEAPAWHLSQAKRMVYEHALERDLEAVIREESRVFAEARSTSEHREAMAAFRERRQPKFHPGHGPGPT